MEKPYVILRTYFFTHQAEMALNKLNSEGIDAYLSDKNMGSFSFLGAGTGGVKLHIAKDDIDRAQEILSDSQIQRLKNLQYEN